MFSRYKQLGTIKPCFRICHIFKYKANFELNLKPKLPVACVTRFFIGDLFNFAFSISFNEFNFSTTSVLVILFSNLNFTMFFKIQFIHVLT
jgi:hypothetical protein